MRGPEGFWQKAALGVGISAIALLGAEARHGFNPEADQTARVMRCAENIGDMAMTYQGNPEGCTDGQIRQYLAEGMSDTYDMPAQSVYLHDKLPPAGYNTTELQRYVVDAMGIGTLVVTAPKFLISTSKWLWQLDDKPTQPKPQPPKPLTVAEYKRLHAKKANKRPPDNLL